MKQLYEKILILDLDSAASSGILFFFGKEKCFRFKADEVDQPGEK